MDRSGVKYRSTSHSEYTYMAYQYIIYRYRSIFSPNSDYLPTCRPADPPIILFGRSAGRHIDSIKYKDDIKYKVKG